MAPRRRVGEFELIARHFAPLARSFAGAGGLESDNAFLPSDRRHDTAVKTDTIVSGVHFLDDEAPERVAAKALRVCLSDLAAGGAAPFAYQLSLALPKGWRERWVQAFARGLAADQRRYGIVLCGGDTIVTPGPLTITITAFGTVARGKGLGRSGARSGDELWASGTIGDGALGLLAARGGLKWLSARDRKMLEDRYRLPRPRTALGKRLIGIARAAADVSDGLLADAARRLLARAPALWANVLGGGDDYELVIAVPRRKRAALLSAARLSGVQVTPIGRFESGSGVRLTADGKTMKVPRAGYVHF